MFTPLPVFIYWSFVIFYYRLSSSFTWKRCSETLRILRFSSTFYRWVTTFPSVVLLRRQNSLRSYYPFIELWVQNRLVLGKIFLVLPVWFHFLTSDFYVSWRNRDAFVSAIRQLKTMSSFIVRADFFFLIFNDSVV